MKFLYHIEEECSEMIADDILNNNKFNIIFDNT